MFIEMGLLSQGINSSKQLKLMESEIKMVANVFSENCRLESFYNSMIPTLNSQSSFTARLLGFRSCSRTQLVKYDFNLLKYIITMS